MTAVETLVDHALTTLPDSISARKHVLRAILHVIKSNHPAYRQVMLMLSYLDKHEAQQEKLTLWRSSSDGHGDGNRKTNQPE